jgi:glycosyltransferase involved in cell wall biosynthesis
MRSEGPSFALGSTVDRAHQELRVAFVLERHLGHATYADNLRAALEGVPGVDATWFGIEYACPTWLDRVPGAPRALRAAARGRREARIGTRLDADAVVFNTQVPAVLGWRRTVSRPYVLCTDVTPRQYDRMAQGYAHRADRAGPARWMKHAINASVVRGAAFHAPWSSWVRTSLIEEYGVDPSRIEVVPPGVDVHRWTPAARSDRADRPLRVLFVGGDFDRKGGRDLLDAVGRLPSGAVELTIVTRSDVAGGDGIRVRRDLNPNDDRLVELYRSSDVFVLPSRSETFGIAFVEAAAAGLPVIAARVGGVEDIVRDGMTGQLIAPGDVDALTDRISELAHDAAHRSALAVAAREHALEHFDAARNAERLVDLARRAVHG